MPFKPGNKLASGGRRPNAGPKPFEIRQLCAKEFAKRVPILCEIADDEEKRDMDRIAAVKELARVGLGDKIEHAGSLEVKHDIRDRMKRILSDPVAFAAAEALRARLTVPLDGSGTEN